MHHGAGSDGSPLESIGLSARRTVAPKTTVIGIAIAVGVALWVADAAVDAWVFYEHSFAESLLLDIRPVEIYMRVLVIVALVVLALAARHMLSKQEHLQRSLANRERFLESVLDALSHPFYVVDVSNYAVTIANQATGWTQLPEGVTCFALTHGRDLPCAGPGFTCPVDQVKKTGAAVTTEHTHFDSQGNLRCMEVHGHPVHDGDGRITHVIEYALDVTERRLAETNRQMLLVRLQHALAEVHTLRGLLPVCSHCKSIRNADGRWEPMESYIAARTEAEFSHSICPNCRAEHYRMPDA